jgi:hypothetical protein
VRYFTKIIIGPLLLLTIVGNPSAVYGSGNFCVSGWCDLAISGCSNISMPCNCDDLLGFSGTAVCVDVIPTVACFSDTCHGYICDRTACVYTDPQPPVKCPDDKDCSTCSHGPYTTDCCKETTCNTQCCGTTAPPVCTSDGGGCSNASDCCGGKCCGGTCSGSCFRWNGGCGCSEDDACSSPGGVSSAYCTINSDCSGALGACPPCVPDSSCENSTCTGQTCKDTCGNSYNGKKCCPDCGCASSTCSNTSCDNGCGGTCPGLVNADCSGDPNHCPGQYNSPNNCGPCTGSRVPTPSDCVDNTCKPAVPGVVYDGSFLTSCKDNCNFGPFNGSKIPDCTCAAKFCTTATCPSANGCGQCQGQVVCECPGAVQATICGNVYEAETGPGSTKGISNVPVEMRDTLGKVLQTAMTGIDGSFNFPKPEVGNYTLNVVSGRYQMASPNQSKVALGGSRNFYLQGVPANVQVTDPTPGTFVLISTGTFSTPPTVSRATKSLAFSGSIGQDGQVKISVPRGDYFVTCWRPSKNGNDTTYTASTTQPVPPAPGDTTLEPQKNVTVPCPPPPTP